MADARNTSKSNRTSGRKSAAKRSGKGTISANPAGSGGVLDEQELNEVTGGSNDNPTESVSLNFGKIKQN